MIQTIGGICIGLALLIAALGWIYVGLRDLVNEGFGVAFVFWLMITLFIVGGILVNVH